MHDTEEWREVAGWRGYEVSSRGQVRRARDRAVLHQRRDRDGLLAVRLSRDGRRREACVHRLVCEAFHGPRPSPAHRAWLLDGRRNRPHAGNVAWMTRAEAHEHRRTRVRAPGQKLSLPEAQEVRVYAPGPGRARRGLAADLASAYGVSRSAIWNIWRGRKWRHLPPPDRHVRESARIRFGAERG